MDSFFPALPELPETVTYDGVGLLLLCVGLVLLLSGISAIRVISDKVEVANKKPAAISGLILALVGLSLILYPEPVDGETPSTDTPPTKVVLIASSTPEREDSVDVDPTLTPEALDNIAQVLSGDILNAKCLDNTLWNPITNVNISGEVGNSGQACLDVYDWKILLDDETLKIYLDATADPGIYGIKAPVPTENHIELSIQIENLKNGQLRFGLIDDSESLKDVSGAFVEIQSNGRMQFLWINDGIETKMSAYALQENNAGTFQFTIDVDGNELLIQQVGTTEDYQKMSLPFEARYLFLGYENSGRSDINVQYFDVIVEDR